MKSAQECWIAGIAPNGTLNGRLMTVKIKKVDKLMIAEYYFWIFMGVLAVIMLALVMILILE